MVLLFTIVHMSFKSILVSEMGKVVIGDQAEFTKTISESDVYLFSGITGDMNPVHINAVDAEKTVFGGRIVHGALVAGFISTVIGMYLPGPGTIYLEQDSKYLKPVSIGDTVTAKVKVQEIINEQKNIYKLNTEVMNQRSEIVLTGFAVVKAPET